MAKISKDENGRTVIIPADEAELKEIREKGVVPLKDDDLDSVSGGVIFLGERRDRDYYFACLNCRAIDFDVIGYESENVIWVRCKQCGYVETLLLYLQSV